MAEAKYLRTLWATLVQTQDALELHGEASSGGAAALSALASMALTTAATGLTAPLTELGHFVDFELESSVSAVTASEFAPTEAQAAALPPVSFFPLLPYPLAAALTTLLPDSMLQAEDDLLRLRNILILVGVRLKRDGFLSQALDAFRAALDVPVGVEEVQTGVAWLLTQRPAATSTCCL
ncbi:uncharacterized protein AMSG_02393 [Thecamonas trahens ATCC 50062]|uniref:Uncharacterized protein n=1 Tax=Thecamonas trahens ATCC 50062 TaxID=461836 RepID=A0A0L0DY06_THETB|nr:hypothetical protein AMSG_02393 [Thecamonas trahens ATCC 50062]KNC56423.1 hypothetical protein AMSG_02393 [Thecamonas trahens ATCC 50062]|eukprot:XP_013760935.1 hypothetical protein AMSG_02393 [Thecamonas trahens ATCC 50062]